MDLLMFKLQAHNMSLCFLWLWLLQSASTPADHKDFPLFKIRQLRKSN